MSHDKVFTLGSLFSGIGGIELGLEWTGRFKTVWQVESDAYCRRVLEKHWPDAQRFEDVRNVGKENLPRVDVICGGFPCQDVSVAGKREGLVAGNRSGLWHEYARVVRELRPCYVIVENVPGLLIGGGLGIVLSELAASGYDAEWSVLSAQGVGAPHLRERLFVLAYSASLFSNGRDDNTGSHRKSAHTIPQSRNSRRAKNVADANIAGLEGVRQERSLSERATPNGHARSGSVGGVGSAEWWSTEPNVGRVAHGVPSRVDKLRALGNAVVPQCAKVVGEWLLQIDAELNASEVA